MCRQRPVLGNVTARQRTVITDSPVNDDQAGTNFDRLESKQEMHNLNPVYVQQMVDSIRRDIERDVARRAMVAGLPKSGFVAGSRRVLGASFIGAGKFIQGRQKVEAQIDIDPCAPSHSALKLAR
jgi:hypothetical protein